MRRMHRIIYQETIPPVLITLVVLTFVVFTREFGRLAEILIRKNAEVSTVFQVIAYLMPSILVFTVPFSFLIGTLIGFSRLSTDSEIIAMRAGGVSVPQMLTPVLRVGAIVLVLTAVFTTVLLPYGNWELRRLRHNVTVAPVQSEIKPRIFHEDLPGLLLYVEDIELRDSLWKGIFLADTSEEGEKRIILARLGRVLTDPTNQRMQLHFEDGTTYTTRKEAPSNTDISRFGTLDIPIDLGNNGTVFDKPKRTRDKTLEDLWEDIRQAPSEERTASLVELHGRIALPLSALIFSILGVTLGIRAPRSGRGYGFFVSIVVAFVYYILFATGSSLSRSLVLPVFVGVWGANLTMGALALLSLRNADREGVLSRFFSRQRAISVVFEFVTRVLRGVSHFLARFIDHLRGFFWKLPSLRFRLARVVDLYMIRLFLMYLGITLLVCVALVCLFTFFELIDDVFANNIPYSTVFDYFLFLQPHLLNLLVPISILIATLVTFGSLQKTNQITALKSCGISVYRIAAPVFVGGLVISSFLFVMQEYVLPYANQRQDNLRNIIKGNPAQTTQPGRHWIFGSENKLYNYNYFSSKRSFLADVTIYQLDPAGNRLVNQVYANAAIWDRDSQSWIASNGWARDYAKETFETFKQSRLALPETPGFFDEEVMDSSKMTFLELERYIEDLQIGGFEVDHLKTELYKKVSFPLVSFIMAILGLPFALTIGRKGTLFGIVAGVLIGIFYWGAFGVFDVLGSNGLLAPLLAAWGPNIVFGAGAGILLSGVRT